jgi:hypothetical protein
MIPFASGSRNLDRLAVRNRRLDFALRSAPIGSDLGDSSQTCIPSSRSGSTRIVTSACRLTREFTRGLTIRLPGRVRTGGVLESSPLYSASSNGWVIAERHERKPIILHGVSVHPGVRDLRTRAPYAGAVVIRGKKRLSEHRLRVETGAPTVG